MSNAHKGSKLILKDTLIPVDFSSAHFDYNIDATGIQYGNLIEPLSGSIYTMRPNEGMFGGGIAIEEGTTNLALNPYFDANWGISAYATKTVIDAPFIDGSTVKAMKLVYSGSGDGYASRNIVLPTTPNRTFTFSFWVKQVGNNTGLFGSTFLQVLKATGFATVCAYTTSKVPTEWTRIVITGTTPSDTTSNLNIILRPLDSATGEIWYALPQLEEKQFSTSFVNGTRNEGKLTYNNSGYLSRDVLTMSCWVNPSKINHKHQSIFCLYDSITTKRFNFFIGNTYGGGLSYWDSDNTWRHSNYNIPTSQYSMVTYVVNSGNVLIYSNGNLVGSFTAVFTQNVFDKLYIGGYNSEITDSIISDVVIIKRALTQEEISAMYISNKPLYNPYDYRSFSY